MSRRRTSRLRHFAGVDTSLWADFRPGDYVMTIDGIAGTVDAVEDGPVPGDEQYLVTLDNSLGGGEYSSSMLTLISRREAASVGGEVSAVPSPESDDVDLSGRRLASDDYPMLGEILVDRPPLSHSERIASRLPDLNSGLQSEAGFWDRVFEPVADYMLDNQPYNTYDPATGEMPSYDWCRFRRDRRCYYPRFLDEQATAQAGYAVWIPEDRGFCPRESWDDQKACPAPSEPGPNANHPRNLTDATWGWDQGGQRYDQWGNPIDARRFGVADVQIANGIEGVDELANTSDEAAFAKELVEVVKGRGNPYGSDNPYSAQRREAAWADVREKATRIRNSGGVQILSASVNHVAAHVLGDTNVYETTIQFVPGTKQVGMWTCGCFLPDAPVLMADGTEKPIKDVRDGEYVLSHEGRPQKVVKAWSRPWDDDIVHITVAGDTSRVITATHDHPFWMAEREWALGHPSVNPRTRFDHLGTTASVDGFVGWRELRDVRVGDYVSFAPPVSEDELLVSYPKPRYVRQGASQEVGVYPYSPAHGNGQPKWAARMYDGDGVVNLGYFPYTDEGRNQAISAVSEWREEHDRHEVKVDADLAWLLGLYAAEGFTNKTSEVGFALGSKMVEGERVYEYALAERVQDICDRYFGTRGSVRIPPSRPSSLDVRVNSWLLKALVEDLVGTGSKTKELDSRILNLPIALQNSFIEGIMAGDGDRPSEGTHDDLVGRHNLSLANEALVRQIRVMLTRQGIRSSVYLRSENSGGLETTKDAGPQWRLSWTDHKKWSSHQFWREGRMWYRVESVEREHYEGEVWDMEVENDHSFVAFGMGVHNCAWAHYSWGRSGRWKKYEGRGCSHMFALLYEAQSRGFAGEDIWEDTDDPDWKDDPSVTVQRPGDYKAQDYGEWRVASRTAFLSQPFKVKWRGMVETVVDVLFGGTTLLLANGDEVLADEVENPDYDPRRGLASKHSMAARYDDDRVKVTYSREYGGRYIVTDAVTGTIVGWVAKVKQGEWHAYIPRDLNSDTSAFASQMAITGNLLVAEESSLTYALNELVAKLSRYYYEFGVQRESSLRHQSKGETYDPSIHRLENAVEDGRAAYEANPDSRYDFPSPPAGKAVGEGDWAEYVKGWQQGWALASLDDWIWDSPHEGSRKTSQNDDIEDGVMVAIRPPDDVLSAIHVQGGEPFENLHITLAYLGKDFDIDRDVLLEAVEEWAASQEVLTGRLGGYGVFENDEPVLWANVNIPSLEVARTNLVTVLSEWGIDAADDHGYTPHLTLAYGSREVPDGMPEGAQEEFDVGTVWVVHGPSWFPVALTGHDSIEVEGELKDEPEAALPEVTADEEDDIASVTYMAKQALKDYSMAEQNQIINEGQSVRASNLDRLDIAGTHYEALEDVMDDYDDDDMWVGL